MSDSTWSTLTVASVRGRSRLVGSRSVTPLKLLNPAVPTGAACHVVLASYGGGLLAGDHVGLRAEVQPEARLLLTTQANTRLYKSVDGSWAEQHTEGHVAAGALAVVLPDPLVPQASSRYRQTQHWQLHPTATLLLADWTQVGRTDAGEAFAFAEFRTELRVSVAGRLTLLDRLALRPTEHLLTGPAGFGAYRGVLNLYLVGPPTCWRYQQLAHALRQLPPAGQTALHASLAGRPLAVAVAQARENATVARALGYSRLDLDPLYHALSATLAAPALLGFDVSRRRY